MTIRGFAHRCADKSKEAKDFDKWYHYTYGDPYKFGEPRSARYYELRKAWKASKKFYKEVGK